MDRLWAAMPWLCLAAVFFIPGVYLEWPADPWEHLRRINEWHVLDTVTSHSSWMKSSYFIPYSLLSWATGLRQIFWLDFYYTGICLLLCWQYYRLARACDLGERASMMFVLLQALLFGNNIFSFYRYYGISSSIYAQLGAVALTRIALEAAKSPQLSLRTFFRLPSDVYGLPPSASPTTVHRLQSTDSPPSIYRLLLTGIPLLALTAFNHVQGLGIAGLGIASVVVWRLIEWKRPALWWLIGGTIIANAFFLWFYPRPAIIEAYRTQGYLNAWYGFNILDFTSPAGDRMLQILSAVGLLNFVAAFFLLRRNHVIAWLTILPLVALCLPCVTVPLTLTLVKPGSISNIIVFPRMLFSIPPGLALIGVALQLYDVRRWKMTRLNHAPLTNKATETISIGSANLSSPIPFQCRSEIILLVVGLMIFILLSGTTHLYHRMWNVWAAVPTDLQLRDIYSIYETCDRENPELKVISTQAGTALLAAHAPRLIGPDSFRSVGLPATHAAELALDFLRPYQDAPQTLAHLQKGNPANHPNLFNDPKARDPAAWITLSGRNPEFVTNVASPMEATTALQNPPDFSSHPFSSKMIPVESLKSYRIEMSVRQIENSAAIVYLAVAWYDGEGKSLISNTAPPKGAGDPRGWSNGTYSYFGLLGESAPIGWAKYGITFGLGEMAAIPRHARFVRLGALLNFNGTPNSVAQLTGIWLSEKISPPYVITVPPVTSGYSTYSIAGYLSAHWPPQQVMIDQAGANEILFPTFKPQAP